MMNPYQNVVFLLPEKVKRSDIAAYGTLRPKTLGLGKIVNADLVKTEDCTGIQSSNK